MAVLRACFLVLMLFPCVFGGNFLAKTKQMVRVSSVRDELFVALGDVLGQGHGINAGRLALIRGELLPMFRSLPKTQRGHLSSAVLRYAVQRYFSSRHGWIMKGFEPHASDLNASELANGDHVLQSKVPEFVRSVLEQKLSHGGFTLDDAVLVVATLERLILDEVIGGVEVAFDLNELDGKQALDNDSFMEVMVSYFITELLQWHDNEMNTNVTAHRLEKKRIRNRYPHWHETARYLTDMISNDSFERMSTRNPFSDNVFHFEDAVRLSQRFSEEFGPFSDHECKLMKDVLGGMDPQQTGRVKMSEFYKGAKGGAWQFQEGFDYLRQVGAIDESSKTLGAQVIIPNYIAGMNNCIAYKKYYAICCLNECDAVYQHLEAAIPAAFASPAEIATVVEGMPHWEEGRNLSKALRTRLDDVAALHDGKVPLHGRLLAQWLHFALPRDCPYPHVVGTTNPQAPAQYEKVAGDGSADTTDDEIERFLAAESAQIAPSSEAGLLMWNLHEVLLDTSTHGDAEESWTARSFLRLSALSGMLGCFVMFGLRELHRILSLVRPEMTKGVQYQV